MHSFFFSSLFLYRHNLFKSFQSPNILIIFCKVQRDKAQIIYIYISLSLTSLLQNKTYTLLAQHRQTDKIDTYIRSSPRLKAGSQTEEKVDERTNDNPARFKVEYLSRNYSNAGCNDAFVSARDTSFDTHIKRTN